MFEMNAQSSSGAWMWLGATVLAVLVVAFLVVSAISAAFAWTMGNIGMPCSVSPTQTPTTPQVQAPESEKTIQNVIGRLALVAHSHQRATPSTGSQQPPVCIPPSKYGTAVVQWAKAMADALYVNPACDGHIYYPNCYYTWYNSSFPPAVIAYGEKICPGCSAWTNGTFQCVSFVRGAYSQVYPMTVGANAFDLWAVYGKMPGWVEIPSGSAPPSQRGMPAPGDVLIFKDSGVGHAAIVMTVQPPHNGQDGAIMFANANSVSPYTTMPLRPDLSVDTRSWPGYIAWGYIRPAVH